ncbi:MAG: hypothetical protein Fur0021_31970 [Candidatus Promineifilaceae bacterium]
MVLSPFAPDGPSVLLSPAWERWLSFAEPQPVKDEIDRQLAKQMLIYPSYTLPVPASGEVETLTAWLHVTNACSLECPYCYVNKSSARMNEEVGLRAVAAVFDTAQQHGFRRVKLKYAGGEAMLHFRLVKRMHQRAVELATETGLGLREVVLSNGVGLRAEDARWMRDEGVKLMISLDGVGELHNRLRPLKGKVGEDTFSRVAYTIDDVLLPLGIRPDITMTVTGINAAGAADVAQWALIERGSPTSFNFYRQNVLSASWTELQLEEQAIIDGMLAAYKVIETNLPERPFLNGLLDRVQSEAHAHTCGMGLSYVVITHMGKVAQCQMHLDAPVSHSLTGDLLPMVAAGPLQNVVVDAKEGCRHCEFRYRCSGGCPLETYRATGRWDVQSPNCRIYKTLYPAALRLEGLRLLKVHGLIPA